MICNKCGGFGNYPYDFTVDIEGNTTHITCTEDCKNSIKTDAMVIMQAVICGFLSTSTYRQGKYNSLWQASNDASISCGGSPVATFSEEDLKQIIWDIYQLVGQIGYKSYVIKGRGFSFINETKNRAIVYEFPFGQIKQNLDALTYNENIVDARIKAGETEEDFYSFGDMCAWNERIECNKDNCTTDLDSCGWIINIGLSFDYMFKYDKPFFNFFKEGFKGIVAVWKDNGKECGLMHDMSTVNYLEDRWFE